ncbi:MAG: hypothetical protein GWP91_09905 [Rhodobacterales bacterium]|nr:hypothetical protein [Rhodobacterales bacterium]
MFIALFAACCLDIAVAGSYKELENDPTVLQDVTAYTVQKNEWRLGTGITYGLLDNTEISTRIIPLIAPLLVSNASVKVTAIQTPKLDVSLRSAILFRSIPPDIADLRIFAYPFAWKASWLMHRKFSLHFGSSLLKVRVDGDVAVDSLGEYLEPILGSNFDEELVNEIGSNINLVSIDLYLTQTQLAFDYRFNRRDSLVLTADTWLALNGTVIVGADVVEGEDTEVAAGLASRFKVPVKDGFRTTATVSWQWSWQRTHVRVGLPIPVSDAWLVAIPRAFSVYWLLGGSRGAPLTAAAMGNGEAP